MLSLSRHKVPSRRYDMAVQPGVKINRTRLLLLLFSAVAPLNASGRIGDIEFFGYKGLDVTKIREALPVHEGDEYSDRLKDRVRAAVVGAIGKEPTDVRWICCDEKGDFLLFIGLPGESNKRLIYNAEPTGKERLPSEIVDLYKRLDGAIRAAVRKGGPSGEEEYSNGYSLIRDPAARALQLAVRKWAIQHERELLRVLEFSSFVEHRRIASDAMGYARQSYKQIEALVRAARDPDDEVRNNATRALGVLARSNAALATEIPPDTFIAMLNSSTWTDRNKGAALLMQFSATRTPSLLTKIRSEALDSLVEMAAWRRPAHAYFSRMLLGRIAGLPEDRLKQLAWGGPVDEIIEAARPR